MECSGTVAAVGDGRDRLVRRRPGVRAARRRRVRRAGRRTGRTADADPRRGRPGHRGGAARGGGTVWSNVFMVAGLQPQETLLVHGGAGGIGSFAIQLAHQLGARVITTGGHRREARRLRGAGRRRDDQLPRPGLRRGRAREATDGGVDVILDNMGAKYLDRNIDALAHRGPAGHHRHAGRHQGRARHQQAAAQARRGHRDQPARPAGRGEVRDLRLGRRARLAAGRRGAGAADRQRRRSRSPRPAPRTR